MKNYEAIKNLTSEQLEKFLDQVFLTGMNTGHYSLVDPDIDDENPFNSDWLNAEAPFPALVENELGEELIIEPLVGVVQRIIDFEPDTISEDICWESRIVLPKGMNDDEI